MATLRWGSTGPEVERVQQLLQAAGLYDGQADGRYGALTYSAVLRFQAAQGLAADGVVGPATLAALQGAASPQPDPGGGTSSAQAVSLHIGINRVDPAQYGGWDGALSGCEHDAGTMSAIAQAEGFRTRQLLSPQATSTRILDEIAAVARALAAGGTFLLTYAGHGGQVPSAGGDEADGQDETWVAYDRQVRDEELDRAFSAFRSGVDVVVVSDSCHSGTVHRLRPAGTAESLGTRSGADLQREYADLKRSYYDALVTAAPRASAPPFATFPRPAVAARETAPAGVGAGVRSGQGGGAPAAPRYAPEPLGGPPAARSGAGGVALRSMPFDVQLKVNGLQREVLDRTRGSRAGAPVQARVVLLAGCADNQLSQEVGGAGVFTTTLSRLWADDGFAGSYEDFIRQIVSQMGPTQTPQLNTSGVDPHLLTAKTPFNV